MFFLFIFIVIWNFKLAIPVQENKSAVALLIVPKRLAWNDAMHSCLPPFFSRQFKPFSNYTKNKAKQQQQQKKKKKKKKKKKNVISSFLNTSLILQYFSHGMFSTFVHYVTCNISVRSAASVRYRYYYGYAEIITMTMTYIDKIAGSINIFSNPCTYHWPRICR